MVATLRVEGCVYPCLVEVIYELLHSPYRLFSARERFDDGPWRMLDNQAI
jgi:hypothetical protein